MLSLDVTIPSRIIFTTKIPFPKPYIQFSVLNVCEEAAQLLILEIAIGDRIYDL